MITVGVSGAGVGVLEGIVGVAGVVVVGFSGVGVFAFPVGLVDELPGGKIRGGVLLDLPVNPIRAAIAGQAVQLENDKLMMRIKAKLIPFLIVCV